MRAMTFSVAAILLVAAGLAIFWPGRIGPGLGRRPGSGRLAKPAPRGQIPSAPAAHRARRIPLRPALRRTRGSARRGGGSLCGWSFGDQPADKTLTDKLNEKQEFEFVETPLKDVVADSCRMKPAFNSS